MRNWTLNRPLQAELIVSPAISLACCAACAGFGDWLKNCAQAYEAEMAAVRARWITMSEKVPNISRIATTEMTAVSAKACPFSFLENLGNFFLTGAPY